MVGLKKAFSGFLKLKGFMPRRAVTAWAVMFALTFQALLPLASALAHDSASDGEFLVICTSTGVKTVRVSQDSEPVKLSDGVSCPFCLTHASVVALAPPTPSFVLSYDVYVQPTFTLLRAERHVTLWRARPRPPRGPPLFA